MKTKDLIIAVVVAVVVLAGALLLIKPSASKKGVIATKAVVTQKDMKAAAKAAVLPKTFSKDMGGLTIKMVNANNKAVALRGRVFKSLDQKSSVYVSPITSDRMQELLPGIYDVELDTVPQKIYKGISVSSGKETVENIGCITGTLSVKVMSSKNKMTYYPVKIFYPKANNVIANASANRPLEILAGTYDVEIGVAPKMVETAVSIEAGKEKVIDLGAVMGSLVVKIVDENKVEKKGARQPVKIKRSDTNELIAGSSANRPVDIRQGVYTVDIGTTPMQTKKDVKVTGGEETVIEIVLQTPAVPVTASAASQVPAVVAPVKGKKR